MLSVNDQRDTLLLGLLLYKCTDGHGRDWQIKRDSAPNVWIKLDFDNGKKL